ncbi:KTSC domain-containing protein [Altererythrobacter sp. C41]|uniref:KTSC domain-containing protein n=1 Tax=Altererythrobacter sp. C41 TaxID=2806021 RepID=UPI00193212E3|nr:KTSC domain-containing protein [Altererythrobacter sp. C41]MBM0169426.1 KTSC domain-containing protein [Altererythrobacter sp. C41]
MPSTAIARLAYRPALGALDVQFVGGRVYRYFDMPEQVAQAFARSGSKGGYFNRAIRDRYRFERLPGWDESREDAA